MNKQSPTLNDRRTFLKSTGVLVTGGTVGLAGCITGGEDDESNEPTQTTADETSTDESSNNLEDSLNIFQWGDYWPDGTVQTFEEEYGVSVNVSNYSSNEEMFNKLRAGGSGQYDLIFPSDYMITVLAEQDMIQKLDKSKLSNFGNLADRFTDPPYDPGGYAAPYQWGTSGIAYNQNMIGDVDITSWEAMWNNEWSGQMTMLDDMRESIGAALKRLGYSLNTTNESEIEEAKELLMEQKDLLSTYDSDNFTTNLINEQASPVHAWSGGAFQAYWETFEDGSSPINYVVPEEGGVVWVDNGAVTKDAANPNAAHAFIDYYLDAEVGAKITNYTYYGSPNEAAEQHITDEILENKSIYPDDATMEQLEFIVDVGQETQLYSDAWAEITSA